MSRKPKILLIGAGALGVFFTSRIAHSADIHVSARSDYEALKAAGHYRIRSVTLGDYDFTPAGILPFGRTPDFTPDYLFVCLKNLDGMDQPELCRFAVKPGTTIVVIGNGLDNEKPFHRAFPGHEIIGGAAYLGASRPAPGIVLHTDGGKLFFGEYPPKKTTERLKLLLDLFNGAGIPAFEAENITEKRWIKLLWNVSFNPVSVLANDADTKLLLDDPECARLIENMMRELARIAEADGVTIPDGIIEETIRYSRDFAAYRPSMLQDFAAGREIELDAILGAPLRTAEQHGLDAPCLRTVYALLRVAARKGHPVPSDGKEKS